MRLGKSKKASESPDRHPPEDETLDSEPLSTEDFLCLWAE